LVELIGCPLGSTICDVGAGSGNYTNALAERGYKVLAVEPSDVMRRQASPHPNVEWRSGSAEQLPLADGSAAAIVCTLAAHHFSDLVRAAQEMDRVCPSGSLAFFTMDPRLGQDQWFSSYFPEIRQKDFKTFLALDDFAAIVCEATRRRYASVEFPLPRDLSDLFMYAPWSTPETYLDPAFRANASGFATTDKVIVQNRVEELRLDLASGRWDRSFGYFRSLEKNDAGFRFVVSRTAEWTR
jgi:SAM-dependent methyltransferase